MFVFFLPDVLLEDVDLGGDIVFWCFAIHVWPFGDV